jgi:glucose/arabinose dehydrogenase
MRNPWRFSFDSRTGDLWLADVGQNAMEEINLVQPGENYGWPIMEGDGCLFGGACDPTGLVLPTHSYPRSDGNCSVTGGFVYYGSAIPALTGAYVFGDYCSGRIWALRWDGSTATEVAQIGSAGFLISSFAQGPDGELYALAYDQQGPIFKLVP